MTATRLARNKHRLNLNCLAAGLGINPTAAQASVGEQFPQGPKCGSCLVKLCHKGEIQGTGNLAHAVPPESQNISKLSKVEFPERQPGLPYEFHSSLSQQQGPPHGIPPIPCRNTRSCTTQLRNSSPAKTTLHVRIRNSLPEIDTKNCSSAIACQKTQNRLPKSGSGVSGFRGSNLTKTMASLQGLESFEPLKSTHPRSRFWQSILCFPASYW